MSQTRTIYRLHNSVNLPFAIEPIEVDRITNKSYYIDGKRKQMKGEYFHHFLTFDMAKEVLVNRAESRILLLEAKLKKAIRFKAQIKELKPND